MSNSKFPYEDQDIVITGQSCAKVYNHVNREKAPGESDFEKTGSDEISQTGAYSNGMIGL